MTFLHEDAVPCENPKQDIQRTDSLILIPPMDQSPSQFFISDSDMSSSASFLKTRCFLVKFIHTKIFQIIGFLYNSPQARTIEK